MVTLVDSRVTELAGHDDDNENNDDIIVEFVSSVRPSSYPRLLNFTLATALSAYLSLIKQGFSDTLRHKYKVHVVQ